MLRSRLRLPAIPVALSGLVLALAHLLGHLEVVLPILPLLLLVISLLSGLYPGCEALVRLAERLASRLGATPPSDQRRPVAPRRHAAGGGLLIANGHAQRPPPLAPSLA